MKLNLKTLPSLKVFLLPVLLGLALTFFSCGEDGDDGSIYLAIYDDYGVVQSYYDENPSIPYGFSYGTSYSCADGSYYYEYETATHLHYGYYYLDADPGEVAGLFADGATGDSRWYRFELDSYGGDIDYAIMMHAEKPIQLPDTYIKSNGGMMKVTHFILPGGKMKNEPKYTIQ